MNSKIIERLLKRELKRLKHPWGSGERYDMYDDMPDEERFRRLANLLALRAIDEESKSIAKKKQEKEAIPNDTCDMPPEDDRFRTCSSGGRVVRSTRGMS